MSFRFIDLYSGLETSKIDILLLASQYQKRLPKQRKSLIFCEENKITHFLAAFFASSENHHFIILPEVNHHKISPQFIEQFDETLFLKDISTTSTLNKNYSSDLDPNGKLWIKTSGSTGEPKYFGHHFENIKHSATSTLNFLENYVDIKNLNWLQSLPLTHVGGIMILFRSWIHGFTTTYIKNLKSFDFNQIDQNKLPNIASLVPTQIIQISENPHLLPLKNSLHTVNVSGAKISNNHLQLIVDHFMNCAIYNTYGATETCSQIAGNYYHQSQLIDLLNHNHELLYKTLGNNKIESNDSDTLVVSKSNYTHCFNGSKITKGNGQVILSDIIEFKGEDFFLKRRSDNTIISGGKNVNLTALKDKIFHYLQNLYQNKIIDLHLLGVEDKYWGQKLILFLQYNQKEDSIFTGQENKILNQLKISKVFEAEEIPKSLYYTNNVHHEGIKPAKKDLVEYHLLNQYQWVFFHGFMGDIDDFQETIHCSPQIIENFKTIDLYQMIKNMDSPFDLELMNQYIKTQIQENGISHKPIAFLGYSLGARAMLSTLSAESLTIERYFIVSSHLGDLLTENEKMDRHTKDMSLLENINSEQDFRKFIDDWYDLPLFNQVKKSKNYEDLANKKSFKRINEYKNLLEYLSVGRMPNFFELIKKDPKQALKISFITGETDKKYTTYAENKNYPHKIIKGHSHALLFETPRKLKESVISLISEDIHL